MTLGLGKDYLGGRFVLGTGNSWPHDFLFLTGFFSSGLGVLGSSVEGSNFNVVSAGEMVS